jgi:hypothetical protein
MSEKICIFAQILIKEIINNQSKKPICNQRVTLTKNKSGNSTKT